METSIIRPFADGEYRFWLGLPQMLELERKCGGVSVLTLEERMRASFGISMEGDVAWLGGGGAMITDVRETIRLAIIGGNHALIDGEQCEIGPVRAAQLVDTYICPARPLEEGLALAWAILHSMISGVDLKKKATGEPESGKRSTRAKS